MFYVHCVLTYRNNKYLNTYSKYKLRIMVYLDTFKPGGK